jgi:hypothetical protein
MSVANGTYTRSNSLGGSGARNYPRFFVEAVRDNYASRVKGREIFREEERVEIVMPGNPYTRPVMRVTEEHREIWPREYAAFKAGQEVAVDGTPLEAWARLRPTQLHELKALGFKTVEQIAGMDDRAIAVIGASARRLCELAQGFMSDSARAAALERLAAENDAKAEEVEDLKLKLKSLEHTLDRLSRREEVGPSAPVRSSLDAFADGLSENRPVDNDKMSKREPTIQGKNVLAGSGGDPAAADSAADRAPTQSTPVVAMPNIPNPRRRLGKHEGINAHPRRSRGSKHSGDRSKPKDTPVGGASAGPADKVVRDETPCPS